MATKKTETIIEVNSLKIQKGTLYKVENKLDKNAPDGFQREGTTKLPRPDAANVVLCKFDNDSKLYDTGFYTNSMCYRGKSKEDKEQIVKVIKKEVVEPYESLMGRDGLLEPSNYEFWDGYTNEIYEGRVYNTDSAKDLLDLYIAMRGGYLTPAHLTGDPRFNGSDFLIKDSIETVNLKQKRINTEQDAIYHFKFLLDTDETKITFTLKSLDIVRLNIQPSKDDMSTAFALWIEKDFHNAETFEKTYKKVTTEDGYEEVILKTKVKEAISKGKIKKEGNEYYYQEVPIGIDVKSIVENLTTKEELAETRDSIRMSK